MSTAIVTGASQGLGHAVAAELAAAGWDLVVDARTAPDLRAAAAHLDALGPGRVTANPGDVTDHAHLAALVESAGETLRLVVNNAGTLGPSPLPALAEYPVQGLEQVLAANVVAPLRLIQLALPALRANRGVVVNVTSDAAVEAYPGWGGYGASKAALEQLSHVLAAEEPGVRVYRLDPGDLRTAMHQAAFPGEDISDRALPEERAQALLRLAAGDLPSGRYTAAELLRVGARV